MNSKAILYLTDRINAPYPKDSVFVLEWYYSTRYLQVGPINPTSHPATNPDKFEFCIWQHNSQKASCLSRPAGLRTVFEPEIAIIIIIAKTGQVSPSRG